MIDRRLLAIRDLVQEDIGRRGLRADPASNLLTACPDDLAAACRSLAESSHAAVAIVTGFFIAHGQPPCGETDGPLGALFLARCLTPLGVRVAIATDGFAVAALEAGLAASGLRKSVPLVALPAPSEAAAMDRAAYWNYFLERSGPLTHIVFLERVGPSHTPASIRAQPRCTEAVLAHFLQVAPVERQDRCQSMRGRDITAMMSPIHRLLEAEAFARSGIETIGIGDGGNEIGMGKIPWPIIERNIPGGGPIACRIATDYLIVAGVSNWGAYALGVGTWLQRGVPPEPTLFDPQKELELLQIMVDNGPLVDGMSGLPTLSVDGLPFEQYVQPLVAIGRLAAE